MLFNKKVLFHIDNEALVSVINKQTSEDKRIMELVRRFVLNLMLNNVVFKIKHISSMNNNIADSISSKQWQRLKKMAPSVKTVPVVPPLELVNMIYKKWSRQVDWSIRLASFQSLKVSHYLT